MYVHPAFKVHRAVALAFAAARGFGHVIACEGGRPVAALLPFQVTEADGRLPRVQFHVARPNSLAQLAAKGGPWLIAVAGDDAYVSPHWYASPEQVPTWLYETVQLSGPVHLVPTDYTCDHLDRLVAQFESALAPKPPWAADEVSSQRRAMLMKSIVAIEMTVETVEASFKLNQHKPDADQVAVVRALRERGKPSAQVIAARMVALRPHLRYE
jgi:transcriptional regulator